MSERVLFAGIDGGGTRTTLVAVDVTGAEIARIQTGTSNAAVIGHEAASATLARGLTELAGRCTTRLPFAAAWFGLSGSDRPEDHRRLLPSLLPLATTIRVTNDAELLLGALPNGAGVALVAGTGSIAFGRDAGGTRGRAGGWGHIFSDEGSGYDLARRMLRAFAAEVDGRGPATSLTSRLIQHYALEDPHQIIAQVYDLATTKGDLARLSSIVMEESANGDAVALDILDRAASELAETALAVARRLAMLHSLSLAMTGGLLIHHPDYRERVLSSIRVQAPIDRVALVTDPALTAARAIAALRSAPSKEEP